MCVLTEETTSRVNTAHVKSAFLKVFEGKKKSENVGKNVRIFDFWPGKCEDL